MIESREELRIQRRKVRRRKRRLITAVILIIVLAVSYFLSNRETEILGASARKFAPGSFVQLPDGMVHYEIAGPAEGEVVVLIHGGSIPYFVWDRNAAVLAKAGFRTLRYDLFGRGYSDRPAAVYDPEFYDQQLISLLDALDIRIKVHLVGLSMGGAIAAGFSERHPNRVNKLVLIDPVGFKVNLPFITKLTHVPGLGEFLFRVVGRFTLTGSFVLSDFYEPAACPEYFLKAYEGQMKYRGFQRALLSTLRNMPLENMTDLFERLGRTDRPILIVWGKEDRTTPFKISTQARAAMPRARFQAIERAGHLPGFERPEVVNPILIEFLKAK
ncbi:alpha/beta hydrolase [bacterium]|nr:alpha/beta hydrolase [bacterium]